MRSRTSAARYSSPTCLMLRIRRASTARTFNTRLESRICVYSDYLNTHVALPPLPEQQRIAAYLDASCAAIDAAVAAKRRQLETLDALRRTVIQESVTKGLDPNVEMRNSDIDWLPEIPKHWNKAKLKRHVQMIRGQFSHRPRNDPAFYDGPYPFIQTGSISAADKFITEFSQTLNEDGLRISKLFPADTVVLSITGAKIAEVAVTTFEACFPDSIVGFVPDHRLNRDYLFYLLVAMKPALLRAMVVTTQPNINYVQIGGNVCSPTACQRAGIDCDAHRTKNSRYQRNSEFTRIRKSPRSPPTASR